jgi:hypothetical protein
MTGIDLGKFGNTLNYEKLTVGATVKTLTAAEYKVPSTTGASTRQASKCLITVDGTAGTNDIRFTTDGTDPVAATTGHLLQAKQALFLTGFNNIRALKMIREASDAVVHITYFET